jgi:hypothetical protein
METAAEAAAVLFSMRDTVDGAAPPAVVPARPDIDLNRAPSDDDEGGGGWAADRSRWDGQRAADGSAPAAHGDSAAPSLSERVRFPLCKLLALIN